MPLYKVVPSDAAKIKYSFSFLLFLPSLLFRETADYKLEMLPPPLSLFLSSSRPLFCQNVNREHNT